MNKTESLSIYCLSQPLLATEWTSVLGDKYAHSLPFKWHFVDDYSQADVIVWDGLLSPKTTTQYDGVIELLKKGKLLVLHGDGKRILKDFPLVNNIDLSSLNYIEIAGWSLLPEDILVVLEKSFQKLKHV